MTTSIVYADGSERITPDNSIVLQKLDALIDGGYTDDTVGDNIISVYNYVSSIPYRYDDEYATCTFNCVIGDGRLGSHYAQYPEETILEGYGDCEDHAILLVTMIEALYKETYGFIPTNLVYVVYGSLDFDNDGRSDGGHGWVIINQKLLPTEVVTKKFSMLPFSMVTEEVIVNDIPVPEELESELETTNTTTGLYNFSLLQDKETAQTLTIAWENELWLELESTWRQPISQYLNKRYPYGGRDKPIWKAFNSQRIVQYPTFLPPAPPKPIEIVDITYPLTIETNNEAEISFTIKNNNVGIIWADSYLEVYDETQDLVYSTNGYVIKWFTRTFKYKQPFSPPATDHEFTVKLYESGELRDEKTFKIQEQVGYGESSSLVTTPSPTITPPPENQKVVVLANSIDISLAEDFIDYLTNAGIETMIVNADHFIEHRTEKNIIILGGPDAYEGVGITSHQLLTSDEGDYLRSVGNGGLYRKKNRWTMNQKVFILAGSDRYETQKAHIENRVEILREILNS
ncbi:MAG: transglutaminase-like domain-containing protein [Thermodesulfobacteriota bacterium]